MRATQIPVILAACGGMLLAQPAATQTRFTTLYDFAGTNPVGVTAVGSNLFAAAWEVTTTQWTCGTISELQPAPGGGAWGETTLYTFAETGGDACYPTGAPLVGPSGVLFGITLYGGAYDSGALYELEPPATPGGAWTESVLYSFDISGDGTGWPAALTRGPNGSFYCSASGGVDAFGALVQLQPPSAPGGSWTQTVLYNFAYFLGPNTLIPGPGGVLYGASWWGQVIQLSPPAAPGGAWTATVLHTLTGNDGLGPTSLILAGDGTLYGTSFGTNYSQGVGKATVFRLTPPKSSGGSWSFAVLKDFGTQLNLNSPVILRNGNLYGTVASGSGTGGQVFELQPPATTGGAWALVHLHQFTGGQLPGGTLVMDKNGEIFGVTAAAFLQPPGGTVYRLATK